MSKAKKEAKKLAKKQKKQAAKKVMLKKAKITTKVITKIKKKHWYFIIAPKAFNERVLGKSLVVSPNVLVGKTIRTNLMELTGDMKKQSMVITFKIIGIKENKAVTRIEKYELIPAAVKRLVRRNRDKMDWSFLIKTKDDVHLRVKPLVMTLYKTKKSARSAIIKKVEQGLNEYFNKNNFVTLIQDMISFKVQAGLRKQLNKIAPVKLCDIRLLVRADDKNKEPGLELEEEPEVVEEPKESKQEQIEQAEPEQKLEEKEE